ncbi:hypothetical protein HNV12_14855 [Methanococcoides sp. SA1]|nr:hypothetical protein [Methanococcoides sp. SA1]
MKPSEIEEEIYEAFNYNKIRNKAEYISIEVKKRVDDLRKEITIQVLAK